MTAAAQAERLVAVADLGEGLSRLRLADACALAAMRASLKQHGQLSAVRAFERDGAVEIFDGFKRLRAARGLGLRDLRAVVTDLGAVDATEQMRELHAGRGLTALEEAWIVRALHRDFAARQEWSASALQKWSTLRSRSGRSNRVRRVHAPMGHRSLLQPARVGPTQDAGRTPGAAEAQGV